MSTQQIRLNINELVNSIKDEDKLKACYILIATIAKEDIKHVKTKAVKPKVTPINGKTQANETDESTKDESKEKDMPHDLSLVFLANEIFKGSLALPEEAILAFDDALMESALTKPTLPNRL